MGLGGVASEVGGAADIESLVRGLGQGLEKHFQARLQLKLNARCVGYKSFGLHGFQGLSAVTVNCIKFHAEFPDVTMPARVPDSCCKFLSALLTEAQVLHTAGSRSWGAPAAPFCMKRPPTPPPLAPSPTCPCMSWRGPSLERRLRSHPGPARTRLGAGA